MTTTDNDWYKDAIIYAVDVANFADSDGDGIGDFRGLTERLGYLAELGVTCLWLLPFYPTPNRDNGYDITDYFGIDPRLGTMDDFNAFRQAAGEQGFRLIFDLVVHHTSDQHPWFQAARRDPASSYRPYYVWTTEPPVETPAAQVFPGVEVGTWTHDDQAGAFYLHQFYAFEPDLDIEHGPVGDEVRRIMAHWCARGAAGLRVDAASRMLGSEALRPAASRQPHHFLRQVRSYLDQNQAGGILIAEADADADQLGSYFADGMHLLYNFLLNNYLFLALAREEAEPLARGIRMLPARPDGAQWGNFLRNLDELDLERLTDEERGRVYEAFAPDEDMRIYNRGIRRRLAPMLDGDQRRLELAFSLLLTLPGTPIIVYGDEIGMGEDLARPQRESVRLGMPWANAPNGGFSTAPPNALAVPVLADGPFGYERVNVADQRRNPGSLLQRVRRMIAARAGCPGFGGCGYQHVPADHPAVLAHCLRLGTDTLVAAHNLGRAPAQVTLAFDASECPLVDLLTGASTACGSLAPLTIELPPYGYRWLKVVGARPDAVAPDPASSS